MIKLFDCTLRDGAHINKGNFGKSHIEAIVKGLSEAKLDFIELGFFKQMNYSKDVTSYPNLKEAYNFISETNNKTVYSLMARADQTNVDKLPDCDGKIKLIRIAFYYDYLLKAADFIKKVKDKGYDITLNLINTPGNSLEDLSALITLANKINPLAVTIVDTFGVLEQKTLKEIAEFYNLNLNSNINIGLHLHENLSLGFALACWFSENVKNRDLIIDGSLLGIGRAPGNVCTELLVNYFNKNFNKNYKLDNILTLIQNDILPIKNKYKWGYSPEYFINAIHHVHRSYAEYMFEKGYDLKFINFILQQIEQTQAEKFNRDYINKLISIKGDL